MKIILTFMMLLLVVGCTQPEHPFPKDLKAKFDSKEVQKKIYHELDEMRSFASSLEEQPDSLMYDKWALENILNMKFQEGNYVLPHDGYPDYISVVNIVEEWQLIIFPPDSRPKKSPYFNRFTDYVYWTKIEKE